jgi:hypothetical protein
MAEASFARAGGSGHEGHVIYPYIPVEGVLVDLCLLLLAALEWLFAFLFAALGQCGMASASSIPPHILY